MSNKYITKASKVEEKKRIERERLGCDGIIMEMEKIGLDNNDNDKEMNKDGER